MAKLCRKGLHEMSGYNLATSGYQPNGKPKFNCRSCKNEWVRQQKLNNTVAHQKLRAAQRIHDAKRRAEGRMWKQQPENKDRARAFDAIRILRNRIKARRQVKLQQIAELVEEFNNG